LKAHGFTPRAYKVKKLVSKFAGFKVCFQMGQLVPLRPGTPGLTLGPPLASMPEPYLVSRELEKVERKAARERIPKVGGLGCTRCCRKCDEM
jgi:hypothetical protein